MAEVANLANNYVVDDQIIHSTPENTQKTASVANDGTITIGENTSQNTQTQETTLQELPQTGVNTQTQPPFMLISASLFLIAAGVLLGFTRRGGES